MMKDPCYWEYVGEEKKKNKPCRNQNVKSSSNSKKFFALGANVNQGPNPNHTSRLRI